MVTTLSSVAPEIVQEIRACRSCGDGRLDIVLDLGVHAISDFYATPPADELTAPLTLVQCAGCGLVQLTHSVSKDRLYRNYWYRSGTNESMVKALGEIVDEATSRVELKLGDSVLDIGANDGTLLDQYPEHVATWGVEPSNLWREADKRHLILHGYYPRVNFGTPGLAKIITSIAMFYDLDDPNAFVKAIKEDLHQDGIWVCQMMDLQSMLVANAFDNICHEHVAYYSLGDFGRLMARHGLKIAAMSLNAVNGGSIRLTMRHGIEKADEWQRPYEPRIRAFGNHVRALKERTLALLEECRQEGKTVLGYGASTKGNTLLQYYGITSELLPAIAERNPDKWGKVTAGVHIPIISEAELRARKPDYLFILPWHFTDGFLEREAELRAQGTRFIVPLPDLRIV